MALAKVRVAIAKVWVDIAKVCVEIARPQKKDARGTTTTTTTTGDRRQAIFTQQQTWPPDSAHEDCKTMQVEPAGSSLRASAVVT